MKYGELRKMIKDNQPVIIKDDKGITKLFLRQFHSNGVLRTTIIMRGDVEDASVMYMNQPKTFDDLYVQEQSICLEKLDKDWFKGYPDLQEKYNGEYLSITLCGIF